MCWTYIKTYIQHGQKKNGQLGAPSLALVHLQVAGGGTGVLHFHLGGRWGHGYTNTGPCSHTGASSSLTGASRVMHALEHWAALEHRHR